MSKECNRVKSVNPTIRQSDNAARQQMNIVIVGHVDHGKSTIIGRLLHDTGSLPDGKLERVKETCARTSKPFEYAFLLDALKDEQAQGITIDAARVFFKTKARDYLILDAPGHIEFLKNMVTGASHAEAALLVIDAHEGVKENSRRHGYMLAMLGIKQIAVVVNKMDLVGYRQDVFDAIVTEYKTFLQDINVVPHSFIPVSGIKGDNIAHSTDVMLWYDGMTVLEVLDAFKKEAMREALPFRMPVQDVYKFTTSGDDRRIVAGTVLSGQLGVGDEIVFYPSGKRSVVARIEGFNMPAQKSVTAGQAVGFTLAEQIYITRGEVATCGNEKYPETTSRMRVNLFWMNKKSLVQGKEYKMKVGTAHVPMFIEQIKHVMDASTLHVAEKRRVERHDVAECIVLLKKAISFDIFDGFADTNRFVIVDEYEIVGGGLIREALPDTNEIMREKVQRRNYKWITSSITKEEREARYGHSAQMIIVTGFKEAPRKEVARKVERTLFDLGKNVYLLGMGSVVYGVDSDLADAEGHARIEDREEHIRRLAEITNIMLKAGIIVVVSAVDVSAEEIAIIQSCVDNYTVRVWTVENDTESIVANILKSCR